MKNLKDKIPVELTKILNEFNKELSKINVEIALDASSREISKQNNKYEQVTITYSVKESTFLFSIFFILDVDKIRWKFYPHNITSTRATNFSEKDSNSNGTFNQLKNSFTTWKNIIIQVRELQNPFDYFKVDKFLKFYSDEIITDLPITEDQNLLPMSSEKQKVAVKLLSQQKEFLQNELNEIVDKDSEKYADLNLAKSFVEKIEEELPRLTEEEVKRNWAISLAGIKKWCENKFLTFLSADKNTDYNLSRSLGSFIGGAFGFPNLGG